jgi:hypothetical protein
VQELTGKALQNAPEKAPGGREESLGKAEIAGIVVAAVAVGLVILSLLYVCLRRCIVRSSPHLDKETSAQEPAEAASCVVFSRKSLPQIPWLQSVQSSAKSASTTQVALLPALAAELAAGPTLTACSTLQSPCGATLRSHDRVHAHAVCTEKRSSLCAGDQACECGHMHAVQPACGRRQCKGGGNDQNALAA